MKEAFKNIDLANAFRLAGGAVTGLTGLTAPPGADAGEILYHHLAVAAARIKKAF